MTDLLLVILTVVAFHACRLVPGAYVPFVLVAIAGWAGYVVYRVRRDHSLLAEWGFTRRNLKPAAYAAAVVLVVGTVVLTILGAAWHGRLTWLGLPATFWWLPWLYPVWGTLQQFVLNGIVARALRARFPAAATVIASAVLFGALHLPDPTLAGLTFAAALVWVPIYLRWRNLWPLGVCHGLLGAVAYHIALARDPLADLLK